MARVATPTPSASSLDAVGASTLLSMQPSGSSSPPLTGAAYRGKVNASVPVWLHSLATGDLLWVDAVEWTGGTPLSGHPGYYSGYITVTGAMWHVLRVSDGSITNVPGFPVTVPLDTAVDSAVVVAGASRHPDHMFLLSSATNDSQRLGIVQSFAVNGLSVSSVIEEVLQPVVVSDTVTVVFDKGVRMASPYLYVYGTDANNNVYVMRKAWSHVGFTKRSGYSNQPFHQVIGTQVDWQYYGAAGFSTAPDSLSPILTVGGAALTSVGPLGFARRSKRWLATTVLEESGNYFAQAWSAYPSRPFRKSGNPIALGDAGTYLNAGLPIMAGLPPSPTAKTDATAPAVSSVLSTSGSSHAIVNTWTMVSV